VNVANPLIKAEKFTKTARYWKISLKEGIDEKNAQEFLQKQYLPI